MQKRIWQPAHNRKAAALPQPYGILVCSHHKIELHGPKCTRFRAFDGMFAHHPRKASSLRRCRGHVAAIGHVRSAALLIRLQKISADDFSILFGDKHLMVGSHPIGQHFLFAHFAWQRVGLSSAHNGLQNPPDRVRICRLHPSHNLHKGNVAPLRLTAGGAASLPEVRPRVRFPEDQGKIRNGLRHALTGIALRTNAPEKGGAG